MEWKHIEDIPVDEEIIKIFREQGISDLYPPQAEALPSALSGKNVVLSVPTASGKSLVAYLTILDAAIRGKKSMYIVPLRALASEKWEDLQPFKKLGIKVGISTGDLDSKGSHLARNDIVVCTSEKADSLLRHGAGWLNEVEVVVADEIHLINDSSRGPTLEVVLSKLRMMNPEIQVIALSATIQNAEEIAEWLDLVPSQVQDTLSFYGFFKQDRPHGRTRVWMCRSISCHLRGGDNLLEYLCEKAGIRPGETTADGKLTIEAAECLGACEYGPCMLANKQLHTCLTREKIDAFLDSLE